MNKILIKIVIAGDLTSRRRFCEACFERAGDDAIRAVIGDDALKLIETERPDGATDALTLLALSDIDVMRAFLPRDRRSRRRPSGFPS